MAYDFLNFYDSDAGENDNSPRWQKDGKDDWPSLPKSDSTHWILLFAELDMRKQSLFVSVCRFYSDAEGGQTLCIHIH